MTRESEVVTRLRADDDLADLVPGGIYGDDTLEPQGVTDAVTTPDVWAGGTFQASVIVRQRAKVPQYRVFDEAEQTVDVAQTVEVYIYALTAAEIEAASDRIFALLTDPDNPLDDAYPGTWQAGLPLMDVPNLPNVRMQRDDYLFTSLRVPA